MYLSLFYRFGGKMEGKQLVCISSQEKKILSEACNYEETI